MPTKYSSKNLDHLGLVAGMVDELGIVELIDGVVEQDFEQRQVSVGTAVKALILNGLGFVNRALYLVPHFFENKPVEMLLGSGIEAKHLNDDTLGRALDSIYNYCSEKLYALIAARAVKQLELDCKVGHLDSTSLHVDGVYNSEQEKVAEGVIHITKGYSKDHRPDLNQVVLQLITEHQAGIPLWMEALSGSTNDKESFRRTVAEHLEQLREGVGLSLLVADSALYTSNGLKELGSFPWITRVPGTIKGVRELVLAASEEWLISRPERTFVEVGAVYAGIRQRWLVVYTRSAHERAEKTINKQYQKRSEAEYKLFQNFSRKSFSCWEDAKQEATLFERTLKTVALHDVSIIEEKHFKGKGRPAKDRQPDYCTYRVEAGVASIVETHRHEIQNKSCFIIATNQLDTTELSNEQMLAEYTPGQQRVERGFRFLKDPFFMAHTLFLKTPQRITALMMIMTLCLLVYSALEYRIRQALQKNKQTFPNQKGKGTEKPTARWIFQFFTGIHVLFTEGTSPVVLNIRSHHSQLIDLLGKSYAEIYSNSS